MLNINIFKLLKIGLLVQIFFLKEFFLKGFDQFSTMKNNFENQNFDMFEEVAYNFGKPDSDISYEKCLDAYVISCPIQTKFF